MNLAWLERRRINRLTDDAVRDIRLDAAFDAINTMAETVAALLPPVPVERLPILRVQRRPYRDPLLVWEIPLAVRSSVFLKATTAPAGEAYDKAEYIVHVRAREFYAMWRASELALYGHHRDECRASAVEDIPKDRKWSGQAECWDRGAANPVPVATVGYGSGSGLGFVDGVTRTLWLTHHGAVMYPVRMRNKDCAFELHRLIGDRRIQPASVYELMVAARVEPGPGC